MQIGMNNGQGTIEPDTQRRNEADEARQRAERDAAEKASREEARASAEKAKTDESERQRRDQFKCPTCGKYKCPTYSSKAIAGGGMFRYRKCDGCGRTFKTCRPVKGSESFAG